MAHVTDKVETSVAFGNSFEKVAYTYVVPDSSASSNVCRFLQLQGFFDEVRDLLANCPHWSITNTVDGRGSDDIGRHVTIFICFEYPYQVLIIAPTIDNEGSQEFQHTGFLAIVVLRTRGL